MIIFACLLLRAQGYAQVTISQKNATLKQIIGTIEKQTEYRFIYQTSYLKQANKVSIDVSNAPVEQVLELFFKDQPLDYLIVDKSITITLRQTRKDSSVTGIIRPQFTGRVFNDNGDPVSGATITIRSSNRSIATGEKGEFAIMSISPADTIEITSIGYEMQVIAVDGKSHLNIHLQNRVSELSDVSVVHSGYNAQARSKATGSYTVIDNKLFNRSVSMNIIDRLEGVTSGFLVNKNVNPAINQSQLSIRGRSTIFANAEPLIVLDNFPYNGTLNSINPNDVESITVLKDAAAAAIWGAFAGNGVIVITTKKGRYNQAPRISVNSNITIGEKPDIYYMPYLSSSDEIDVEQFLFSKSFYRSRENSPSKPILPPVIELLIKKRDGLMPPEEVDAQIEALRKKDVRKDIDKYALRNSITQQYALNINGGGQYNYYSFSVGYDQDKKGWINNEDKRITLNAQNTYALLKNKLEFSTGIQFSRSISHVNDDISNALTWPYTSLIDTDGNAAIVPNGLRQSYKDTAGNGILLDWNYRPLDEAKLDKVVFKTTEYQINTKLNYKIIPGFVAQVLYQYYKNLNESQKYYGIESNFTRNLINSYTQLGVSGAVSRPIPLGGIFDQGRKDMTGNSVRGQLTYDYSWGQTSVKLMLGAELRSVKADITANRLYGYNKEKRTSIPVDYVSSFPMYYSATIRATIPNPFINSNIGTTSNYISSYFNGIYSWKQYTLSASARKEESNIFGVRSNQKGVPLWSLGMAWQIDREKFYHITWLPGLKLRITNGYMGNVDRTVSAFTVATLDGRNIYNAITASITNPPNPSLRWEKVNMTNFGIDFASKNNRISGSIDFYMRKANDLIGYSPLDPTTGNYIMRGNTGSMKGHGSDIVLNTRNIDRKLKWQTTFLFSYASDKIAKYLEQQNSIAYYYNASFLNPVENRPLYSIYSLRSAGLDPDNGDPRGYKDGHISKDYAGILNSTNLNDLQYHGSANPVYFGSVMNTFSWKRIEFTFNISWKAGYYFRRNSINYSSYFSGQSAGHPDLVRRWQKPGDEKLTSVPSLKYPADFSRDQFYIFSDALVDRGDHVRLQDIGFNYTITRSQFQRLPMNSVRLYLYVNNIGILWRANKQGIDPDYLLGYPSPRRFSIGMQFEF